MKCHWCLFARFEKDPGPRSPDDEAIVVYDGKSLCAMHWWFTMSESDPHWPVWDTTRAFDDPAKTEGR